MAALINEAAEGGPGAVDEVEVRLWLASPEDLAFAVVEDEGGAILAYADLEVPREAADRAWLDVRIPRRTLGDTTLDAVLRWAEERACERGRRLLRASVAATSPIGEMLSARGFRLIRHSLEMRVGWVRVLGVKWPWRRRGLGLALLLHSFGELLRRGIRTVGLGVDAENLTGAVRLYERAGMWVEHRYDICERRLA